MKFVKSISLFFLYPVIMLGIGFFAGVKSTHFFYPGEQSEKVIREESNTSDAMNEMASAENLEMVQSEIADNMFGQKDEPQFPEVSEVSAYQETLSVDTEYVLEETDIVNGTVVETTWRIPDKYIGLNREQFLEAMEVYEAFPPLSEMERGFVNLEVLSFSRERVVVQMNYQYIQPGNSFYLAVCNNEVVVYLEDMETIYINTGIELTSLPENMQQEIMQMIWIEDEESLYDFLESYSS